ncbi:MAG: HupE/UreJ family protein [Burkholderiales bacterium]
MSLRHTIVGLAGLVAVGIASVTGAHQAGVSTSRIDLNGRRVAVEVNALVRDFEKATGVRVAEQGSGDVNPVALALNGSKLTRYVIEHASVGAGGARCTPDPGRARAISTHVLVSLAWTCPDDGSPLTYRVTMFQAVDGTARHVAVIAGAGGERTLVFDAQSQRAELGDGRVSSWQVIVRFVLAGIEHIFLGYDHVAFLLAVILWGRRLLPLIKVITAFTVAHSITLALAVLEIVVLPSSIVEPLIAASIVFVAAENFFVRDIVKRWRITFLFGFIHGFGFASALREFGLPKGAIVPALVSFNLGVEIGQAAIVCIAVPLLLCIDRLGERRRALSGNAGQSPVFVYACSGVILALGLYWLVQRTLLAPPA